MLLRYPNREWVSSAAAAATATAATAAAAAATAAAAAATTTAGVARSDGAKPPSPHLPGRMLMKISDFFGSVREIS